MKQSESVNLDQLKTPEARALYKILDLIEKQLPLDEPIITDLIEPLFPMLKSVCLDIDKNPKARKKASDFLNELQEIHKNWVADSWEYLESEDSDQN